MLAPTTPTELFSISPDSSWRRARRVGGTNSLMTHLKLNLPANLFQTFVLLMCNAKENYHVSQSSDLHRCADPNTPNLFPGHFR